MPPPAEGTAEAAARVAAARATQAERSGGLLNAHLEGQALEQACALEAAAHALLTRAAEAQGLSARGWDPHPAAGAHRGRPWTAPSACAAPT